MDRKALKEKLYLSGMDEQAAALARREGVGFEITEFCWAPQLENSASLEKARGQMRGNGRFWLHAPFAEMAPCAIDPLVREVTKRRYGQTLEMARGLGVSQIVIHGGFIPYVYFPEWYVEQSVLFWREFLQEHPGELRIALENVMEPGPETLVEIVRQVDDPRLGLCLDVGHANTCVSKLPPLDWIGPMAPWLMHVHAHNNAGGMDQHAPLGEGTIPMEILLDRLLETCPQATVTLENRDCAPSLDWLRKRGYLEEENA